MKDASGKYETGECEKPGNESMVPVPGSAGRYNSGADVECATGKVVGISIGYDGDISFDVNDGPSRESPGPGVAPYTKYHNFQPGPGGSDAPGGIDVEIPIFDELTYLPQILVLRPGFTVRVCGRFVADMHQLWNEFHPITFLDIVSTGAQTPPTVLPVVTGMLGTNGWYTSDVSLSWNLDSSSPAVTSSTGCPAEQPHAHHGDRAAPLPPVKHGGTQRGCSDMPKVVADLIVERQLPRVRVRVRA